MVEQSIHNNSRYTDKNVREWNSHHWSDFRRGEDRRHLIFFENYNLRPCGRCEEQRRICDDSNDANYRRARRNAIAGTSNAIDGTSNAHSS